jgi:hypothetical protein
MLAWSRDSTLLLWECPLKLWWWSNGRIKSYGPIQPVLWSCRWYDPNGHRRCGVGIPRYSKENSLRKILLNFEHDPTVGSKVMDPFSRSYSRVSGTTRTDIVGVESGVHATTRKTAYGNSSKNLSAIQRSDQKLWTFSAGTTVEAMVWPERTSSMWSSDSWLLQGKQPMGSPLKL